jgi:serine O-acetyltransferase
MTHSLFDAAAEQLWESYSLNKNEDTASLVPQQIPNTNECIKAIKHILNTLLPVRFIFDQQTFSKDFISNQLKIGFSILEEELLRLYPEKKYLSSFTQSLLQLLPEIRRQIIQDIEAAFKGDPAASSYSEVILAYPSILAVSTHRISHELYKTGTPFIPRIISEWTHSKTGIDIHPGAEIQEGFFIDHGTGVVIGETSKIGKNVKIYQGVTLGARSFTIDANGNIVKGEQRHPVVEDGVIIYANATILGGETIIGKNSVIGGNVFLMESVPPESLVISKSTSDSSAKNFEILSRKIK